MNWVRKYLCQSDLKSQHCLLPRWLPITCILVITDRNSCNMFKRHYVKNDKKFLEFFFNFSKLHKILRNVKRKIRIVALRFGRLLSPTNVVTLMPKSSRFRTTFESPRFHASQKISKSARQHFYRNFTLTKDRLSYKTSPSVRSEIAVLFVNTLTVDHM